VRSAFSLFLVLHGMAHLPGFLIPWRLAAPAEMPYTTTVLGGSADLGTVGIRIVSIMWLLTAVAFVVAGAATFLEDAAWRTIAILRISDPRWKPRTSVHCRFTLPSYPLD
jgi:hypothetical protein